jgi:hypothetical protein
VGAAFRRLSPASHASLHADTPYCRVHVHCPLPAARLLAGHDSFHPDRPEIVTTFKGKPTGPCSASDPSVKTPQRQATRPDRTPAWGASVGRTLLARWVAEEWGSGHQDRGRRLHPVGVGVPADPAPRAVPAHGTLDLAAGCRLQRDLSRAGPAQCAVCRQDLTIGSTALGSLPLGSTHNPGASAHPFWGPGCAPLHGRAVPSGTPAGAMRLEGVDNLGDLRTGLPAGTSDADRCSLADAVGERLSMIQAVSGSRELPTDLCVCRAVRSSQELSSACCRDARFRNESTQQTRIAPTVDFIPTLAECYHAGL